MYKIKTVEIIVKVIIIIILLKFVARWPYDKIVYIIDRVIRENIIVTLLL